MNILEQKFNNIILNDDINDKSLEYINNRILTEICENTIQQLQDTQLLEIYKNTKSVKLKQIKLHKILETNDVEKIVIDKILYEYILELIPPGTKGVIRGNKFNEIIKLNILNMNLNKDIYDIKFEQNVSGNKITEIPDWYILNKKNDKLIIGMNQLDLWTGGQQLNRATKYINNERYNTNNIKLLCVVCNKIILKSNKNKIYNIFNIGFTTDTLCYINNLRNIINTYFNL